MHQHELTGLGAVEEDDRDLLLYGAERHDGGFGVRVDGDDLSGNGKAHGSSSMVQLGPPPGRSSTALTRQRHDGRPGPFNSTVFPKCKHNPKADA